MRLQTQSALIIITLNDEESRTAESTYCFQRRSFKKQKRKRGRKEREIFLAEIFFSSFLIQNTMYEHVIFTWRIFCLYWMKTLAFIPDSF